MTAQARVTVPMRRKLGRREVTWVVTTKVLTGADALSQTEDPVSNRAAVVDLSLAAVVDLSLAAVVDSGQVK